MRNINLIREIKIELDLQNLGLIFSRLYFQQFLHELQDVCPLVCLVNFSLKNSFDLD